MGISLVNNWKSIDAFASSCAESFNKLWRCYATRETLTTARVINEQRRAAWDESFDISEFLIIEYFKAFRYLIFSFELFCRVQSKQERNLGAAALINLNSVETATATKLLGWVASKSRYAIIYNNVVCCTSSRHLSGLRLLLIDDRRAAGSCRSSLSTLPTEISNDFSMRTANMFSWES